MRPGFFLVPLEHREVYHPGESHHIGVDQFQPVAEEQAQSAQGFVGDSLLIGHKEDQVAHFGPGAFLQGFCLGGGDELLRRAFDAFGREGQGGQALGAHILGNVGQIIYLFAGVLRTTRGNDALDHPAGLERVLEDLEIAGLKDIRNVGQLHGEAQIRLIDAKAIQGLGMRKDRPG